MGLLVRSRLGLGAGFNSEFMITCRGKVRVRFRDRFDFCLIKLDFNF